MSRTTKHTIEFEVVVKWDLDPRGEYPHQFGIPSFVTTKRWVTSEQLEALGITRPVSPYEPQVGDIVEVWEDTFPKVTHLYLRVDSADGEMAYLSCGDTRMRFPFRELTFIARPEVKS
jgi:hypothetical protein